MFAAGVLSTSVCRQFLSRLYTQNQDPVIPSTLTLNYKDEGQPLTLFGGKGKEGTEGLGFRVQGLGRLEFRF